LATFRRGNALDYRFNLVARVHDMLTGVERGQFDVAVGATTITPDRLAPVDFTYPARHSGVAVIFRKEGGPDILRHRRQATRSPDAGFTFDDRCPVVVVRAAVTASFAGSDWRSVEWSWFGK
jgi:ABC-type amino acid transport substrate-binding protein